MAAIAAFTSLPEDQKIVRMHSIADVLHRANNMLMGQLLILTQTPAKKFNWFVRTTASWLAEEVRRLIRGSLRRLVRGTTWTPGRTLLTVALTPDIDLAWDCEGKTPDWRVVSAGQFRELASTIADVKSGNIVFDCGLLQDIICDVKTGGDAVRLSMRIPERTISVGEEKVIIPAFVPYFVTTEKARLIAILHEIAAVLEEQATSTRAAPSAQS